MERYLPIVILTLIVLAILGAFVWRANGHTSYTLEDRTRGQLSLLASTIQLFVKEKYPFANTANTLTALVEKGYAHKEMLIDPWGQEIRYQCLDFACEEILIYSIGPNGFDEQGKGDDIALNFKITPASALVQK